MVESELYIVKGCERWWKSPVGSKTRRRPSLEVFIVEELMITPQSKFPGSTLYDATRGGTVCADHFVHCGLETGGMRGEQALRIHGHWARSRPKPVTHDNRVMEQQTATSGEPRKVAERSTRGRKARKMMGSQGARIGAARPRERSSQ
jgi:hypothetical protein